MNTEQTQSVLLNLRRSPNRLRFPGHQVLSGLPRRYRDGEAWSEIPRPNVERAVIFDSFADFQARNDTFQAWQEIDRKFNQANPVRKEETVRRMLTARTTQEPLTLFVPWGVRPNGQLGENEVDVMARLRSFQDSLRQRNINAQTLIMPADLYATEVNNQVDPQQTATYFQQVTELARETFGFTVKPWSQIRQENWDTYQQRAVELTPDEIAKLLTKHKVEEAIKAAGRRSGYKEQPDIERAAFAYLRERICEAELLDSQQAVKVSAVAKNKDNEVDRDLPRLYIIPEQLQFPWLK